MLLARRHRGAGLDELAFALGDSLVVIPDLGFLLAEKRLARGEHRFARLNPRRGLGCLRRGFPSQPVIDDESQ